MEFELDLAVGIFYSPFIYWPFYIFWTYILSVSVNFVYLYISHIHFFIYTFSLCLSLFAYDFLERKMNVCGQCGFNTTVVTFVVFDFCAIFGHFWSC